MVYLSRGIMVQIFINIICLFSLIIVVAYTFNIIFNTSKSIIFTNAYFITQGVYTCYFVAKQLGFPIWFSIYLSLVFCIIFSILIEFFIYKQLRRKGTSSLLILIASLGLYVILQNIISIIWGDDTKILRTGDVTVGNEIFGAYITNVQIITIVVSASLLLLSLIFLRYNKIGKNIRAVSANSELANIQGINSDKVILWATGIGSGMAAIAGILVGFDTGMTPTMGFNLLLYGVVAMIIGGVGSTKGLIGGALLLAAAQHLTAYYIDSKWMDTITYVILILFLIWKPLGFSGQRLKKIEI
jgi:branched-chain amino acid transport system permease protein